MDFYISLIVGVSQAFIFNPADKAIYKSIIDNTPIMGKKPNYEKIEELRKEG
jgi:hypothetical protein